MTLIWMWENLFLTKYVVGAKTNSPKNPRRLLKKGISIPMNIVKAAIKEDI